MLTVVILGVVIINVVYTECRNYTLKAECHHAECHYCRVSQSTPIS
jgi:hypothetical protein